MEDLSDTVKISKILLPFSSFLYPEIAMSYKEKWLFVFYFIASELNQWLLHEYVSIATEKIGIKIEQET